MLDYASDPIAAIALLIPNVTFFSGVTIGYCIKQYKNASVESGKEDPYRPSWEVDVNNDYICLLTLNHCLFGVASYVASDTASKRPEIMYAVTLALYSSLSPISKGVSIEWGTYTAGLVTLASILTAAQFFWINPYAALLTLPHISYMMFATYKTYTYMNLSP